MVSLCSWAQVVLPLVLLGYWRQLSVQNTVLSTGCIQLKFLARLIVLRLCTYLSVLVMWVCVPWLTLIPPVCGEGGRELSFFVSL